MTFSGCKACMGQHRSHTCGYVDQQSQASFMTKQVEKEQINQNNNKIINKLKEKLCSKDNNEDNEKMKSNSNCDKTNDNSINCCICNESVTASDFSKHVFTTHSGVNKCMHCSKELDLLIDIAEHNCKDDKIVAEEDSTIGINDIIHENITNISSDIFYKLSEDKSVISNDN